MTKKLVCLFLAVVCLGCGSKQTLVDQSVQSQTLHYGNGKEPQTLDPHLATGTPEWRILDAVYEGLMTYDPKTALPIYGAAESHTESADKTVYTFKIRDDAKWSDGQPVTAKDFVYGWKRLLSAKLGAEYAFLLYPVKNAAQYHKREITDFDKVGVKALNDKTLQVTLKQPTSYFLSVICHFATYPARQDVVEKYGAIDDRNNKWSRPGFAVTNGAFSFKDWKINGYVKVEKNPEYWDQNKVKLKEVVFYPIDQRQTDDRRYRAGETHLTHEIHLPKLQKYIKEKPEHLYKAPIIASYYYVINTKVKPLNDPKVRMALKLALDRQQIVNTVTHGAHMPSGQFIPKGTGGYESDYEISYELKRAKDLLAEAGFPEGKGFPEITLSYNTDEENRSLAEAVQQMWRKNLGINIQIQNKDWKVHLNDVYSGNFHIARKSWYADFNDPINYLDIFKSTQAMDKTGWVSPAYDGLLDQSAVAASVSERMGLLQKAEKELLSDGPIIPLYTFNRIYLKSPLIKGWYENPMDAHPLKYVYLESKK